MLGHIENNAPRHKLKDIKRLTAWLAGVVPYLFNHPSYPYLHPTYKTDEQKRLARNAKARKARATKGTK